jgi:hypothetical protein
MKKEYFNRRKITLGKRTILKLTGTGLLKMEGGTWPNGDGGLPTQKPAATCDEVSKKFTECSSCKCPTTGAKAC